VSPGNPGPDRPGDDGDDGAGRREEPADAGPAALVNTLGYGHFTALRVDDGRVRGLRRHLDRLVHDCDDVFGAALDPDEVRARLRRAAEGVTGTIMLRVTVHDPDLRPARPAPPGSTPAVLVTTRALSPAPVTGLRLRGVEYVRDRPQIKHTGLFGALDRRRRAQAAGYDDALFVGPGGWLAEGPTWNLALLLAEGLVWPEGFCLPGVTRDLVEEVARAAGLTSVRRPVARAELAGARAAFATSAGVGVVPVLSVDGHEFPGVASVSAALRDGYAALPGDRL
jgi:branched-subunit amino acid aminotransferase/4-amino-4-deoxychorismate lyase